MEKQNKTIQNEKTKTRTIARAGKISTIDAQIKQPANGTWRK